MKLNEKEAVLCWTQEEFEKVCNELKKDGINVFHNFFSFWKTYKEKTCVRIDKIDNSIYHCDLIYYQDQHYKILTYSEFMGDSWFPKVGEKIWYLETYGGKFYIYNCEYKKEYGDSYLVYRTRQLARDAKKAIQEVLKKARKG